MFLYLFKSSLPTLHLLLFYLSSFYPARAEVLLAAFRYFDKDGRGFLTKEKFTQLMLEEGEPFTQVGFA